MIIFNQGDLSNNTEDLVNGTLTVGELRSLLENEDDNEAVLIRTDSGFAELDSTESY